MKAISFVFLCLLPLTVFGQETTIHFEASDPTPVFQITAIYVETSGMTITSDVTEVAKKMELLAIPPSTITVPNGDLLLNWGGTLDFNRTFAVHADGRPLEVRLLGNRSLAMWSLGSMGFGALATLIATPSSFGKNPAVPVAVPFVSGALALGGLVGLLVFSPRVEVR